MNSAAVALSNDHASNPKTPQGEASLLRANADLIDSTLTKLRALTPPAGDEATLEAAYDKAAALPKAARDLADAIEQGNRSNLAALQAAGDQAQQVANDAADAYGLTTCGSGASNTA